MNSLTALDSETDKGYAVLLTRPDAYAEPRNWEACTTFCMKTPEMMCWNLDYDAQAMLKYLPQAVRARLALFHEVNYGLYRVRYVPHKFLKVFYYDKHLFTVYDLFQFYNCSLATAAEKLGLPVQKGSIPKSWYRCMKARLADPKTRDRVLQYGLDDARVLQHIIDHTVSAFASAGLTFERPYSNAVFAERYFHDKFKYRRNWQAEKWAGKAYHGGMIECLKAGYFRRAYYYDIHSAYPSIIAKLIKPDGHWVPIPPAAGGNLEGVIRDDAQYAFVDCTLSIPQSVYKSPIPLRLRSGVICYPTGTFRKTITLTEYRLAYSRGWVSKIHGGIQHIWATGEMPFAEIRNLYQRRIEHPAQSYALKIIQNATYGKLAQVIERWIATNRADVNAEVFDNGVWIKKSERQPHTSFVYAAEITAQIRCKVFEATDPRNVIFYATDAVMTTKPVDIPTGPNLGEWSECETVKDLVVVGSGVYDYRDMKGKPVVKLRGFAKAMDLKAMLKRAGKRHTVPMWVLRNTSLKQSVSNPGELNVLRDTRRILNVNFDHKRAWPKKWNAAELTRKNFDSDSLVYYGKVTVQR